MHQIYKELGLKRSGFTIVELLIVVVVIAILAAITIVAYNGITKQASDSALATDVNTLVKSVEMRHAVTGSYGVGSADIENRDDFLDTYNIRALDTRIVLCEYDDPCTDEPDDKTKMYIFLSENSIQFIYWSNANENWVSDERDESTGGPVDA